MPRRTLTAVLLVWLLTPPVFAHELQANRLTLVLRDRNHLTLTFFLTYTDALHRALAPARTLPEFALVYSAMKPEAFEQELLRAQAKFQTATRLTLSAGEDTAITNWTWPEPSRVQATLREHAMQAIVAPGEHPHEAAVEIRAEATSPQDVGSVTLRLPEAFQPVLVVSYRPSQVWVEPKTPFTVITV